jgi:hypothetical protein
MLAGGFFFRFRPAREQLLLAKSGPVLINLSFALLPDFYHGGPARPCLDQ